MRKNEQYMTRGRWVHSWADHVVRRDAELVESGRDPERLQRYLHTLALQTATVVDDRTLYEAAGINRVTARAYDGLLQALGVLITIPAWHSNRLKRLVRRGKRLLCDSGLAAGLCGLDLRGLLGDGIAMGRLLETWAILQLLPEAPLSRDEPRPFHLRDEQGRHEVDLLFEWLDGRILAFEIKASSAPAAADARHLIWLRDRLGKKFVRGFVLHTCSALFEFSDRIEAAPIASLAERPTERT